MVCFIDEFSFENIVCKMFVILSRPEYTDTKYLKPQILKKNQIYHNCRDLVELIYPDYNEIHTSKSVPYYNLHQVYNTLTRDKHPTAH